MPILLTTAYFTFSRDAAAAWAVGLIAAIAAGSGAACSRRTARAPFLGDAFQPSNDVAATHHEYARACDIDAVITGGENTPAFGGDTEAESASATGGNGGDAIAVGGSGVATDIAAQTLINVVCVPDD